MPRGHRSKLGQALSDAPRHRAQAWLFHTAGVHLSGRQGVGEASAALPGPVTQTVELAVREADLGLEGWKACAARIPAPYLPPCVAPGALRFLSGQHCYSG